MVSSCPWAGGDSCRDPQCSHTNQRRLCHLHHIVFRLILGAASPHDDCKPSLSRSFLVGTHKEAHACQPDVATIVTQLLISFDTSLPKTEKALMNHFLPELTKWWLWAERQLNSGWCGLNRKHIQPLARRSPGSALGYTAAGSKGPNSNNKLSFL